MEAPDPGEVISAAACDSYAQLLSFVAARAGGDLAGAEDALADAFLAAIEKSDVEEPGQLEFEAITLGRLLATLAPKEPEGIGLPSLMLHCHARQAARRKDDGTFVPLPDQEVALWSVACIEEADSLLRKASAYGRTWRFQLEAAIQSVHAARRVTSRIDWRAITAFYEALGQFTPALGARIGYALALAESTEVGTGLAALDDLEMSNLLHHQPYWAARADLLRRAGRLEEARQSYDRALGLTKSGAVRQFLMARHESGTDCSSCTFATGA